MPQSKYSRRAAGTPTRTSIPPGDDRCSWERNVIAARPRGAVARPDHRDGSICAVHSDRSGGPEATPEPKQRDLSSVPRARARARCEEPDRTTLVRVRETAQELTTRILRARRARPAPTLPWIARQCRHSTLSNSHTQHVHTIAPSMTCTMRILCSLPSVCLPFR